MTSYYPETNEEKRASYCSRRLTKMKTRYSTWAKELAGIVYVLRKIKFYLLNHRFTLYTDNKSLATLQTQNDKIGKYSRYRIFFSDFNFEVKHKKGTEMPADILSRLEKTEDIKNEESKEEPAANIQKVTDNVKTSEDQLAFRSIALEDIVLVTEHFC